MELPTGSTAEHATVRIGREESARGVEEGDTPSALGDTRESEAPKPQRKKELRLRLDHVEAVDPVAGVSTDGSSRPESAPARRTLRPRKPRIVEIKKYPKEMHQGGG